jgi:flagellar hook assembly protein FlgD
MNSLHIQQEIQSRYGLHLLVTTAMASIYPNPFRNKTDITFSVAQSVQCRELKIYDATGRLVKSFDLPTPYSLLPTSVCWDGTDELNRKVPAGVYFVQLETDAHCLTRKAILLR